MDAQRDAAPVKLAVLEILDGEGRVRATIPIWQWPVTIGRAVECDVVLDDPHVAARHASIAERDGVLTLAVGETVNGVRIARRLATSGQVVDVVEGESVEIGHTHLRIRRASDALAPERPLRRDVAARQGWAAALGLALLGWIAAQQWLNTDPGGRLVEYLPGPLVVVVLLGVWSGVWSVGSRLASHRFDYWAHLGVAVGYSLAANVAALLLPLSAFALGWALPSRISGIVVMAVIVAMVLAHLTIILPARRRVLATVMATLLVAGVSLFLLRTYQVHDRLFTELFTSAIGPPALRLAPTIDTARFIDESRALKAVLDAHAKDDTATP